jgi:hypothetical protein
VLSLAALEAKIIEERLAAMAAAEALGPDEEDANAHGELETAAVDVTSAPAGADGDIGWSYALPPGRFRIALAFAAPPRHGFSQSEPHPQAVHGEVRSNDVDVGITPRRGFFARVLGR